MSMVVKTHLDANIELPDTAYTGCFIGAGGVLPLSNHPYVCPV